MVVMVVVVVVTVVKVAEMVVIVVVVVAVVIVVVLVLVIYVSFFGLVTQSNKPTDGHTLLQRYMNVCLSHGVGPHSKPGPEKIKDIRGL